MMLMDNVVNELGVELYLIKCDGLLMIFIFFGIGIDMINMKIFFLLLKKNKLRV